MRFTDTCANQFRSKHVNADLRDLPKFFGLPEDGLVTFRYYESNEGKNLSDQIGAMFKNSFMRGIFKNTEALSSLNDVIDRMRGDFKKKLRSLLMLL